MASHKAELLATSPLAIQFSIETTSPSARGALRPEAAASPRLVEAHRQRRSPDRQADRQTGRMVKRSDTQYLSLVYIDARYIDMGFLSVRPSVCPIVHVGVASNQSQTFLHHLAWHHSSYKTKGDVK